MKKLLTFILGSALLLATPAQAQYVRGVTEEDGAPACWGYQVKFPNTSVTDNGDGTCSVAASGADGVGVDEILEEGAGVTKRAQLNFIGASITCVDNAGATRTDCTLAPGAEVNDLEATDPPNVENGEVYVGTGSGAGAWIGTLTACAADEKLEYTAAAPDTFTCEAIGSLVDADVSDTLTASIIDLEAGTVTNIASTEIMVGVGVGDASYVSLSADATMDNAGAVTVVDDSHAHVVANIDSATSAAWAGQISDEDNAGLCAANVFCMGGHEHAGASLTDDIFLLNSGDTGTGQYIITEAGNALDIQNTTDATPNQVAIFRSGNRATPANNDAGYICLSADNDLGTQVEFARMTWFAIDIDNASKDGALRFDVMRDDSLIEMLYLSTNSIVLNADGNDVNFNLEGANDINLLWADAGLDTITVGSNTSLGKFGIDGDADEIQLMVQGNATQTTPLIVAENSAGTDQMTLSNTGVLNVVGSITEAGNAVSNDTEIEAVVEPLIDTLANLTSVQSLTIGLADAGADAIYGWDDTASTYENLLASEVMTIVGGAANDFDGSGDVSIAIADVSEIAGGVGSEDMEAAEDFGDFTCDGNDAGCTLDTTTVDFAQFGTDIITGATAVGVGTFTSGDTFLCQEAGVGVRECDYDDMPGGAETNDLESVATNAASNEVFVGTGAGTGAYIGITACGANEKIEYTDAAPNTFTCETIALTDAEVSNTLTASLITVADTEDATTFVGLWSDASGDLAPLTDETLTYVANTGVLSATSFASTPIETPAIDFDDSGDAGTIDGSINVNCPTANDCDMIFAVNSGADSETAVITIDTTDGGDTTVTIATDSVGTAEVVLPAGSIDSTEILDETIVAADIDDGAYSYNYTLLPQGAVLDDGSPPAISVAESTGTGTPRFYTASFDADTDEILYWTFAAPSEMASGNWTATVLWYANDVGPNEDAIWAIEVSATTEADAADMLEQANDAVNTESEDCNETEATRLMSTDIAMSNIDSVAAGDVVTITFWRDADDSEGDADADALTSDAVVVSVKIKIPRT